MRNKTLDTIHYGRVAEEGVWELFHENSKTSRYSGMPPDEVIVAHMQRLWESLPFDRYPAIELPEPAPLDATVESTINARETARAMIPCDVTLQQIAKLFHCAYGITRDCTEEGFPRPFRTVPSGGALYPLELFFYSAHVEGLELGIYHYNSVHRNLRWIQPGDHSERLCGALVQSNLATDASLLVFITALFERSVFKYGDRGYRFVLLEAGHVAQNLNLAATALGLSCTNIGGYFDRQIDELLGLDGLAHSTVYMTAIGGHADNGRA